MENIYNLFICTKHAYIFHLWVIVFSISLGMCRKIRAFVVDLIIFVGFDCLEMQMWAFVKEKFEVYLFVLQLYKSVTHLLKKTEAKALFFLIISNMN